MESKLLAGALASVSVVVGLVTAGYVMWAMPVEGAVIAACITVLVCAQS